VLRLLALAVGVELFGELADAGLLGGRGVWEREGFETGALDIDGIIADAKAATGSKRPSNVLSAANNS